MKGTLMNEGIFIKTSRLSTYPTKSQELMQKVVQELNVNGIEVITHKDS